jgi:hypothetical protein
MILVVTQHPYQWKNGSETFATCVLFQPCPLVPPADKPVGVCVQFGSIYVDGSHLRHNLEVRLNCPQYLPNTSLTSGLLDSHASALHCLCVWMMVHLCFDVHAMCVLTMVYLCMDGCAMQLGDEVRFSAEAPPVWLFDKIPSTSNGEGSSGTSGN